MSSAAHRPPEKVDLLIIGAGVSGLYCAWRLLRTKTRRRASPLSNAMAALAADWIPTALSSSTTPAIRWK
ncbi:hypothetical protein PEC18_35045 [Paucibacter sp. O1-1]|nr:hypothetical protein [Paucibacter sp. O1-1]MDA3830894.1 hypothetical protein [Paucibacter sp. O1-1]